MDKVVDHLLVFKGDAQVQDFPGNYTDYRAELERRRAHQQFEYDQYRGEQARLRAAIQGTRERASQMKKAPSRKRQR